MCLLSFESMKFSTCLHSTDETLQKEQEIQISNDSNNLNWKSEESELKLKALDHFTQLTTNPPPSLPIFRTRSIDSFIKIHSNAKPFLQLAKALKTKKSDKKCRNIHFEWNVDVCMFASSRFSLVRLQRSIKH